MFIRLLLPGRQNPSLTDPTSKRKVPLPLPPPALSSKVPLIVKKVDFHPFGRWQPALLPTWGDVKIEKTQLVLEWSCQPREPLSSARCPAVLGSYLKCQRKHYWFFSLFCQLVNKLCFFLDFLSSGSLPFSALELQSSPPFSCFSVCCSLPLFSLCLFHSVFSVSFSVFLSSPSFPLFLHCFPCSVSKQLQKPIHSNFANIRSVIIYLCDYFFKIH